MSSRKDGMHLPPLDWHPASVNAPRADLAASVDAPSAALVPLPRCSVVFFHHLEKTGGTTLRSILQRHAQLGEFDLISFVNRFDKLSLQIVLHRLHTLVEMPGTSQLDGLRLAVEIHIGGHMSHPYFNMYSLPDLLFLRSLLRAKGCRCNLVTLLRHPLLHHLSWHYHFCNHRVPLCFWRNPPDCEARLAMGLTCHDGPHLQALTPSHERAVRFMWEKFDLVGVVELFDEFVLSLSDLVGLRHPAYRMQIVASETLSRQQALRNWTSRTCASLVASPPADLMSLIIARMRGSASNAKNHLLRNGGSSTGGPRGHMECRGYGPCVVEGVDTACMQVLTTAPSLPTGMARASSKGWTSINARSTCDSTRSSVRRLVLKRSCGVRARMWPLMNVCTLQPGASLRRAATAAAAVAAAAAAAAAAWTAAAWMAAAAGPAVAAPPLPA